MARAGRRGLDQPSAVAAPPAIHVGVLGPVMVMVDGSPRPVSARRQRAVSACLALHAGEAVSADRLLEEVWGDDLPDTGRRAVPFQIAKLRSSLEPDRVGEGTLITTSPAGYVLHTARECVDALHFEELLAQARELFVANPTGFEALMVQALWKPGPPVRTRLRGSLGRIVINTACGSGTSPRPGS